MTQERKLGKLPVKLDRRIPNLGSVLTGQALPPVPLAQNWYSKVSPPSWGMLGNDVVGDCSIAALFHMRKQWATYARRGYPDVSTALVLKAYSQVTGYVPGDESTDQGAALTDVLKAWFRVGFDAGTPEPEKITAFCGINTRVHTEIKYSVAWFGGAYIGIQMPAAWQDAKMWDTAIGGSLKGPYEPGSWGGHCVNVVGYDAMGLWCVTWGGLMRLTWDAWDAYVDEAWCVLSDDWEEAPGTVPSGLPWAGAIAAMEALRHHRVQVARDG